MKVFYDHQAFSLQDYGGISRIFSELLKAGNVSPSFDAHLSILFSNNAHLAEVNSSHLRLIKSRELLKGANQIYNIVDLAFRKFDIYHPTYYGTSLIKFSHNKPVIATFHDLIHERLYDRFYDLKKEHHVINQKKQMASHASHIIAVSENTKKDIIELYGIPASKISVIYLGSTLNPNVHQNGDSMHTKQYLLYVGNRFSYKNFAPFLKAIADIIKRNDVQLICAGGRGFNLEEKRMIHKYHLTDYVIQVPVNDNRLAWLYSNALAFVFPSLYEGFGIPILEAFSCGCPCVLSNQSSLPEVGGDAAVYFDPYDEGSVRHAINTIIIDESLRKSLKEKGKERLKNFSWGKHVSKTVDVYNQVL